MGRERTRRTFLAALGSGAISLSGCTALDLGGSEREWDVEPVEHEKLVGAHYYPWYGQSRNWRNWLERVPGEPVLGEYNSADEAVINQHVKWAREHGINWFSVSWAGPAGEHTAGYHDEVLNDYVLEAELGRDIDFSILYESITQLRPGRNGPVDFDREHAREKLRTDFQHLEETYFDEPTYVTVDGRPFVFIYATFNFEGAVGEAFHEARDAIDADPYLVADRTFTEPWMDEFDAVTAYVQYTPSVAADGDFDDFVEYASTEMRNGYLAAQEAGLDYIPNVMPGLNDSLIPGRDNPVLERDPDGFRDLCQIALDHMDPDLDAVLVTSFNEWPEWTSVEPAEEFGTTYLEIIEEELATAEPSPIEEDYGKLAFDFNRTVRPENANRDLALMLDTLELRDAEGETLVAYDVGVPGEEPLFVEGAFPPERSDDPDSDWDTWRWLGGPTGQATLYIETGDGDPESATFHGTPVRDGIEADIYYNDSRTDHIVFGERGVRTYTVSLQRGM